MDWARTRDLRVAGCALLCAVAGAAWQADAALATYGKVTVVKQNVGGNPADAFGFTPNLYPAKPAFSLLGGEKKTFEIDCNVGTYCRPGTLAVTEDVEPGYTMTGAVCRTRTGTQSAFSSEPTDADPVDADTTLSGRTINLKIKFREWVKCTVTNTRDKGSIKVVKDVVGVPGYTDGGRFDLLVDGQVKADEIADGGATPVVDVTTGTHTVGEAAGAVTALADYDSRVDCSAPGKATVSNASAGQLSLSVGKGEAWTCVITNKRKRGTLTVVKDLRPATDAGRFDLTIDGAVQAAAVGNAGTTGAVEVPTGSHTVAELANGTVGLGEYVSSIDCRKDATAAGSAAGSGPLAVTVGAGDAVVCTVINTRRDARIHVVKTGPSIAYSGDRLSFGFAVTNPGNEPLTNVTVSDDKCPDVQGPTAKEGGDQDATLESGETWRYTCSYVATHAKDDVNPVVNTATATGKDSTGKTVKDTDRHETRFLHPAITIDKDGPATAVAGERLTYTLAVTNTGDSAFGDPLEVTDSMCLAKPELTSKNDDATPSTLDAGETWTYSCQVQTQEGQTEVVNTATVTGTDANDRTATDDDTHTTTLTQPEKPVAPQPQPQAAVVPAQVTPAPVRVAPARVVAGTARLRGPSGCPTTNVVAAVTGRRIAKVTWVLDGKTVGTTRKADRSGRWTSKIRTASLRYGSHRLQARVQFEVASRTATKTLRLAFSRCRPAVRTPRFTG